MSAFRPIAEFGAALLAVEKQLRSDEMSHGEKGMLIGTVVGCLAAWSQWEGNIMDAVGAVIVIAATGFLVGRYIGKRRAT